jgi:hypothetical protein
MKPKWLKWAAELQSIAQAGPTFFVECELLERTFSENTETLGAEFFDPGNLPELSLPRTTREQVEMCFAAKKSSCFETLFD